MTRFEASDDERRPTRYNRILASLQPVSIRRNIAARSSNRAITWIHVVPGMSLPPTHGSYHHLVWDVAADRTPNHLIVTDKTMVDDVGPPESSVPLATIKIGSTKRAGRLIRAPLLRANRDDPQTQFQISNGALLEALISVLASHPAARVLVWGDIRLLRPLRQRFPKRSISFTQRHYDFPDRSSEYRYADYAIFQTPGQVALATGRIPSLNPFAVVIPNGVETDRFVPSAEGREGLRQRLGIPGNAFVVSVPSKLSEHKGGQYLDAWIRHYSEARRAPVHFLIPNDFHPSCTRRLRARLMSAFEAPFVSWLDKTPRREMPATYQASDLTIMPGPTREGFGLSILESMSCGTPSAAVATGAPPEYIHHGTNGYLLPLHDIYAAGLRLFERMRRDPEGNAHIGAAGREFVVASLSREKVIDNFGAFFDDRLDDIDASLGRPTD